MATHTHTYIDTYNYYTFSSTVSFGSDFLASASSGLCFLFLGSGSSPSLDLLELCGREREGDTDLLVDPLNVPLLGLPGLSRGEGLGLGTPFLAATGLLLAETEVALV